MGHSHYHGHHHNSHYGPKLFWAIAINVLLTVVQIVGGILSGSLSLVADALHNFSDAGALVIAYLAQRISGIPADKDMTFGYGRAEILGALINSVTLVVVGIYLLYEAGERFFQPQPVDGWTVIGVAGFALVIDLVTAGLTHSGSKESINMKAAFIHNVSDALASVVVIISGILILNFQAYWVDLVATIVISAYVLYQSIGLIKSCVRTLMQAVPEDLERTRVIEELLKVDGVLHVHHVHIWSIHERFRSMEAHIQVSLADLKDVEQIKTDIKHILKKQFKIGHSTLEFESQSFNCGDRA